MGKTIIIFLLFVGYSIAELPDSIIVRIDKLNSEDKILFLNDLGWENRDNNPEMMIECGKYATLLADSLGIDKYKSKSVNWIGVGYRNIGLLSTSEKYFELALEIARQQSDSLQIGFSYNNICRVNLMKGDYSAALEYAYLTLNIFQTINNEHGVSYAYLNLGRIYKEQQRYEKAREYLLKCIELREKLEDSAGIKSAISDLAEVYRLMGNHKIALEKYKQNAENNSCNLRGLAVTYSGISNVYSDLKDFGQAFYYNNLALQINNKIDNKSGLIQNYIGLGKISENQNKYGKAENYYHMAEQLSVDYGFEKSLVYTYNHLAYLYVKKNNTDKAVKYFKLLDELDNKIHGIEIFNTIADLQTSFEVEKTIQENLVLKVRVEAEETQKKYLLVIVGLCIVLAVLAISRYRTSKKTNKLLKDLNFTKDKFFRILAHELRNPFTALLGYTDYLESDYENIPESERREIARELNYSLHNLYFLLDNLLSWTANQARELQVRAERFLLFEIVNEVGSLFSGAAKSKAISIIINVPEEIACVADKNMTKTVFRNLLSNSLKFTPHGGEIKITALPSGDKTKISVADNGVGIKKENLEKLFDADIHFTTEGINHEKGSGLGLILVKEFVEKNGGEIEIDCSETEGCNIIFTLPSIS